MNYGGVTVVFLVLLAKLLCPVGAQCPSLCVCSDTDVNCSNLALREFPSDKFGIDTRNVDFSYNNITSLGAYTIRTWMLVSLRYLNVSNNALKTLNEKFFMAQSGLEVIDLSNNELEYISEKTFKYIPRLKWLSLANNKGLKILDGVPFLINDNLQVLHLEECGLYRLSLSSFNGLSNLRELHLSYNKIRSVEMGPGTILKIRYLELSHNNLQEVPSDLTQLQNLEVLGMRYNELRNLSDIMLVERHVKRLNISNNKWECLCEVCSIDKICENVSCQVDVCESASQKDLVRCPSEDITTSITPTIKITTSINEQFRGKNVSTIELHEPQQNASTTTRDYLLVTMCILVTLCIVLSTVCLCIVLREINRRSCDTNPEQCVPLTVRVE